MIPVLAYVLLPFALISSGLALYGQQHALIITALIASAVMTGNVWIAVFASYMSAWQIIQQNPFGMVIIMYFLVGIVLYQSIATARLNKEMVFNVVCIGAIVQALLVVCDMWGFYVIDYILGNTERLCDMFTGTLCNKNFVAAYLAISIPFFTRKYWIYFTPVLIVIVAMSHATTAIVAMLIGCTVCFNWRLLAIIVPVAFTYVVVADPVTFNCRKTMFWHQAVVNKMGPFSYLFGLGIVPPPVCKSPLHNEWLEVFYRFGIVGLSPIFLYINGMYKRDKILFSAFIIAAVDMLGTYTLHIAPVALLVIIILGMLENGRLSDVSGHN